MSDAPFRTDAIDKALPHSAPPPPPPGHDARDNAKTTEPDDQRPPLYSPGRPAAAPLLADVMQQVRGVDTHYQAGERAPAETDRFGPYHIVETIGEGGMGTVYKAEQKYPVRRVVALKVIKRGMDSKEVIARFEVERQALALMSHPNVARVYDAAVSDGGRPYFVMEYVAGVPLTKYCDENRLTTRERLELFIPVCHAVQHAHQKGIIHRDVKPSNVMVALFDGRPVPKVIDFGIAKATSQALTDRTLFTKTGALVGTPEYMAPEQAVTSGLDVDTRADLYSLGVVLYELLTGTLPFDAHALHGATPDELAKIIREKEPHKPSTRLGSLAAAPAPAEGGPAGSADAAAANAGAAPAEQTVGDPRRRGRRSPTLPEVARRRRAEPKALVRELRGDLDWIVMKCLEKDRTRRYATAHGLAMDIRRHLEHEPVAARPPSTLYRLRKLTRKHRLAVTAAAAVFLALLLGTIGTTAGIVRANRERAAALEAQKLAEEASDFMTALLREANPLNQAATLSAGQAQAAVALLDAAARQLDAGRLSDKRVESRVRLTLGAAYAGRGTDEMDGKALDQYRRAVRLQRECDPRGRDPHTAKVMLALASLHQKRGTADRLPEAEELALQGLRVRQNVYGDYHPHVADAMDTLAGVLRVSGKVNQSSEWARRSLAVRDRFPDDRAGRGRTLTELAKTMERGGDREAAIGFLKQAYALHAQLGRDHQRAGTASALAEALVKAGQDAEAARYMREVLEIRRHFHKEDEKAPTGCVERLHRIYLRLGWHDKARDLLDEHERELAEVPEPDPKARLNLARWREELRAAISASEARAP